MKYEGQRKSSRDPQMSVYSFVFGIEEINALTSVLEDFKKKCPLITETQTIRARIGNMISEFRKFQNYRKMSKQEDTTHNYETH